LFIPSSVLGFQLPFESSALLPNIDRPLGLAVKTPIKKRFAIIQSQRHVFVRLTTGTTHDEPLVGQQKLTVGAGRRQCHVFDRRMALLEGLARPPQPTLSFKCGSPSNRTKIKLDRYPEVCRSSTTVTRYSMCFDELSIPGGSASVVLTRQQG
jgi:hypothetical protein